MDVVKTLQWVLLISMAGTYYIGHGAFGIIGKEAWLPYFNLFGGHALDPRRVRAPRNTRESRRSERHPAVPVVFAA